jgi:hypothetical protein
VVTRTSEHISLQAAVAEEWEEFPVLRQLLEVQAAAADATLYR